MKLQLGQETFNLVFTMPVKSSRDISGEPVRAKKVEEQVITDLDLHNNGNRPSLTSDAVAEERQGVSSKNTIDEMADRQ